MIKGNLLKAKDILQNGNYTCVLCRGEEVFTSDLRGVKPLLQLAESGKSFRGYSAADKVVGKATAFLYVLLKAEEVYAGVISKSALQVLEGYGIKAEYDVLAENIINRKGDGICPFEKAVLHTEDVGSAFEIIKNKMREMQSV